MRYLKYLVFLISVLSVLHAVKSEDQTKTKFQTCDAAKATPEATGCPKGSNCIENGTVEGVLLSYCVCAANFTVNQNFLASDNSSHYCIVKTNETHATESSTVQPIVSTTLKPEPTDKIKSTESAPTTTATLAKKPEVEEKADVKMAPAPEPHHAITGILVPILVVLGFLGGVFLIRKYDVIDKAHGYIRNRNQQTRYNGLMENDFDDDPLLI